MTLVLPSRFRISFFTSGKACLTISYRCWTAPLSSIWYAFAIRSCTRQLWKFWYPLQCRKCLKGEFPTTTIRTDYYQGIHFGDFGVKLGCIEEHPVFLFLRGHKLRHNQKIVTAGFNRAVLSEMSLMTWSGLNFWDFELSFFRHSRHRTYALNTYL